MVKSIIFSVLFLLTASQASALPKKLVFGSVAMDIPAEMHKRLKPLTNYLSKELGVPVELKLSPNMKSAIEAVAKGEVDFAYLTPVAYLKSYAKGKTRILVKTLTNGKGSFQLMISVKDDSPYKSVNDLKGKLFAFGDKAALLQRAVVVGSGINLDQFGEYKFIGHYDNIARGVQAGDFDAGILKDTKAFAWEKKGLRILHSSEPLPPYNITAKNGLSEADYKKIRDVFLKLSMNNAEHKKVIKALSKKYNGFAETSDAEYDVIRKLIAPFNK